MSKALQDLKAVVKQEKQDRKAEKLTARADSNTPNSIPASREDKLKVLDAVNKTLNTQFKTTNSLIRIGDKADSSVPHTATGIASVDNHVLGIGGLPDGRIIEIFGPESAGKTTITLQIIAEEQEQGSLAAFVDAEHALDPQYAKGLGVDMDNLFLSQPDSGEQALETVLALVESRAVSIVVVDSVAALVPQAELDGEMGDSHMGLQARLMSQAMRKLRGACSIHNVKVIFINQIREKIGVMFGNPETTTGGRALKFYASVRLDVRRDGSETGKIMQGGEQIGYRMKVKCVKNKVAAPFKECSVPMIYGKGIDKEADFISYASDIGVIQQDGAWFKFEGEVIGQGLLKTVDNVKSDVVLFGKIKAALHSLTTKKEISQPEISETK